MTEPPRRPTPTEAAFCLIELIYADDEAVDHRFLEVNDSFISQTGMVDPVGRLVSEVVPEDQPSWSRTYAEVLRTRQPVHLEVEVPRLGRWFDIHAMPAGPPGEPRVALLFDDITARRRDAQALRDTEERLKQALSAGEGIGTYDWDIAADQIVANDRFASLYGVDAGLGRTGAPIAAYFAGIHPDDIGQVRAGVDGALTPGGTFSEEYRVIASGVPRWILALGEAKFDAQGKAVRLSGVVFDIDTRKRAEARQATLLQFSDALRDLTDPADIAYAASEILGHALGVSRVGYAVIDKMAETVDIARDWSAPGVQSLAGTLHFRDYGSYIEDLKAGVTVAIADVMQDGRTRESTAALKAIDAASFVNMPLVEQGGFVALFFATHNVPRRWADDELAFMREVAERVRTATERVRADIARRRSEEQFRVFAQAVPGHIWAAHGDGRLYWFNDQALSYVGASREGGDDTIDWGTILHPDDRPAIRDAWARSMAQGTVLEVELRIRRHDGVYRWFLVRAEPVRGADGAVERWVGTDTDIDDRRRQAHELAELNATLEGQVETRTAELMEAEEALRQSHKMEAVGQLSGGLAHDFNNLLTGITGSLELMQVRIAQGRLGDVERYVLAAQGAAKRAAALTHRLLAFSRRQTLDPKPTDVNRLVAGLEELVRRTVGPAIAVEVVAAGGLWPTLIDPNQLENAVLNLCINARDAMPDGGRLTIETGNKWLDARAARERDLPPGQYLSLCVSDTGTGMTPEIAAKAFDPFFTTKPIGQGTGLGLSMIYGFARQSGGQVRIYSEPGEGALICLYLPRFQGDAVPDEPEPVADQPRSGSGETVLVVDDEPTVRMLVIEVLEELGYHALEAGDGAAGLAILRSNVRIDLLVTDVGLPGGMNGRQMADAARQSRPSLEVLFITGYAENAVVGNGHLSPGMHVMTKPFAMDALATRIRGLIPH